MGIIMSAPDLVKRIFQQMENGKNWIGVVHGRDRRGTWERDHDC